MIAAVVVLTSISIGVIFLENRLPVGHEVQTSNIPTDSDNASKLCMENGGQIVVVEKCQACSEFKMKSVPDCLFTSYIEKVLCQSSTAEDAGKEFTRSCRRSSQFEERQFWLFECVMAVVSASSYVVVHIRQRRLDRLLMEKVHRQIASGV